MSRQCNATNGFELRVAKTIILSKTDLTISMIAGNKIAIRKVTNDTDRNGIDSSEQALHRIFSKENFA